MGLWQKFKQGAKEVGQSAAAPITGTGILLEKGGRAVAEKYRERYSSAPEYRERRIEEAKGRMAEMKVKAKLAEQEAKYSEARTRMRQQNPLVRMAQNFGGQRQATVGTIKKGKKRVQQVVQQSPYAHILGENTGRGYENIIGSPSRNNYEHILGKGGKKKPYAHIFGK